MRILGRPQNEFVVLQNVHKTGIKFRHCGDKFHYSSQNFMKRISRGDAAADLVKQIDFAAFVH
jgi:hypothetical protein